MDDTRRIRRPNYSTLDEAVGAKIRELREHYGMRQQDLADYLRLSRSSISNIEAGRQAINVTTLMALQELFGDSVINCPSCREQPLHAPGDDA